MATNRNFIVKQGIDVGLNANAGSTWTSNRYWSNKADVQQIPSLSIDFTRGQVDARVQTYRQSNGTYVTANGKMVTVGSNVTRIEYDSVNVGQCLGLVGEEGRSNMIWYSDIEGPPGTVPLNMVDPYPGTLSSPQVATDQWIGPNKSSCKHFRTAQNDDNVGYMNTTILSLNRWYTASVYVYIPSSSPATRVYISLDNPALTWATAVFKDADMTIRDRWQRITLTVYATAGTAGVAMVMRVTAPLAVGVPVVYSDAWQFELGEYASTFIPTLGSQVYRADDFSYMDGFDKYHKATEFTVYTEATPKWSGNTLYSTIFGTSPNPPSRGAFSLVNSNASAPAAGGMPYNGYTIQAFPSSTSTAMRGVSRALADTGTGFVTSGSEVNYGIVGTGTTTGTFTANTTNRMAMMCNTSILSMYVDGSAGTTVPSIYTPTANGVNQLLLGRQHASGDVLFWGGYVRKLQYFPKALTLNEIKALTEK